MQIKHPYSNTAHFTTSQLSSSLDKTNKSPNPCAGSTSRRTQKRKKLAEFCINCPNQQNKPCDGICKELTAYEQTL